MQLATQHSNNFSVHLFWDVPKESVNLEEHSEFKCCNYQPLSQAHWKESKNAQM
jgi:hypothetical protein